MGFNDYDKVINIIVEFSKKWEGISKNWGVGSDLLNKGLQSQDGNLREKCA
jgi:hypothetical protein